MNKSSHVKMFIFQQTHLSHKIREQISPCTRANKNCHRKLVTLSDTSIKLHRRTGTFGLGGGGGGVAVIFLPEKIKQCPNV